jgi:hypothetical protein
VGAVDEGFGQVDFALRFQVLGERTKDALQRPIAYPVLKAPVAGLIRRVARGQVLPGRAGAQDPKHAMQDVERVPVGSPTDTHVGRLLLREQRLDELPLIRGEIHVSVRSNLRDLRHFSVEKTEK